MIDLPVRGLHVRQLLQILPYQSVASHQSIKNQSIKKAIAVDRPV
ncbi:hypothetical protein [Moorena sp. SIOASIH]|nr:hypothetical protein [Moorena sp. SIOASIH]